VTTADRVFAALDDRWRDVGNIADRTTGSPSDTTTRRALAALVVEGRAVARQMSHAGFRRTYTAYRRA
jgi:hypothetical protein